VSALTFIKDWASILRRNMKLLIAGGTGFIGTALCSRLLEERHDVVVLSRYPEKVKHPIKAVADLKQLRDDDIFDVVINLAGEPIANKRWSDQQKKRILSSRINTTEKIFEYIKKSEHKPLLFISGSAIGYYGIGRTDNIIDEDSVGDDSFSSQLCQKWEATTRKVEALGVRTCVLRTGIVLGRGGGALNKMLPLFKIGLGGRIGDGKQWMSWIHLDDLLGIIIHCIDHDNLKGAINGTSPNPVTNQVFTKTLGTVIKRPIIFPMPEILVRLLMGQMGEELLLSGKRISPRNILGAGYEFQYNNLEDALINIVF
jgi:uncharacterized protein (TIGR01777 family)